MAPVIPFHSQLVDESNYGVEGFPDLKSAQDWTDRICGLACVKMAIVGLTGREIRLWDLLQEGLKAGAYSPGRGWIHEGLVALGKKFGINGTRESVGSSLETISEYLSNGDVVIASVSDCFDTLRRGGHLIVLLEDRPTDFLVHHPSSWKEYNWPNYTVSKVQFSKSFSDCGNIVRFYGDMAAQQTD